MNPRILLAMVVGFSVFGMVSAAQSRPVAMIDVAAMPAYPPSGSVSGRHGRAAAGSHRRAGLRTARGGSQVKITHPGPRQPESASVDANGSPAAAMVPSSGWPRTLHAPATGLVTINGCAGLRLRVAAEHASKFQGFFCALRQAGHRLTGSGWTGCQAGGHMVGSKHDWGGACDIRQSGRNRAAGFMYRVRALAAKFGLKDGCSWRGNPDCGHVEVQGSNAGARRAHYALRGKSTVTVSAHRFRRPHYAVAP